MNNVRIGKNAKVSYAILDENSVIGDNVVTGHPREEGGNLTVIARDSVVEGGNE